MKWRRLGRIFSADKLPTWAVSHTQAPVPFVMEDRLRVFFSTRNQEGKSLPLFADFDINDPTKLIQVASDPLINLGKSGTFDEDGVMPSSIVKRENELLLYYTGWNKKFTTPYHNSIGLAISKDNGFTFKRVYDGPIIDRTKSEPYLAATPTVVKESDIWKMWYVSGTGWKKIDQKYEPTYVIKYAESQDGVDWKRFDKVLVKPSSDLEAFATPAIMKISGIYHMWYCYRMIEDFRDGRNSYKIGYANSANGFDWNRMDYVNLVWASESDWDSTMSCYPALLTLKDKVYMLYNGNSFGKDGFGCLCLENNQI